MSEMADRVKGAMVLAARAHNMPFALSDADASALARAAIEAMREPTDAMCRANSEDGGAGADEHVRQDWRAMIDAALK